jgi:hypothetical protein
VLLSRDGFPTYSLSSFACAEYTAMLATNKTHSRPLLHPSGEPWPIAGPGSGSSSLSRHGSPRWAAIRRTVSIGDGRDRHHPTAVRLAPQPTQQHAHQHVSVEPVGLGTPYFAWNRDTGWVDHIDFDTTCPQTTREPETVTLQVLELLAERISQPGKPAHAHSHREVLPLDVACRNMGLVRASRDHCALRACHARRGITARPDRLGIVKFNNLSVVHIRSESPLYRVHISCALRLLQG